MRIRVDIIILNLNVETLSGYDLILTKSAVFHVLEGVNHFRFICPTYTNISHINKNIDYVSSKQCKKIYINWDTFFFICGARPPPRAIRKLIVTLGKEFSDTEVQYLLKIYIKNYKYHGRIRIYGFPVERLRGKNWSGSGDFWPAGSSTVFTGS